jgi:hypothetical protein
MGAHQYRHARRIVGVPRLRSAEPHGHRSGALRILARFVLVVAVVLSVLQLRFAPAAQADDATVCSQNDSGNLVCPVVYPPPDLLNPGVMANADNNEYIALQIMENQAVDDVLTAHDLPASDHDAVLSWGRDEAEEQFMAIVLKATETPIDQRTGTQQVVVRWIGKLLKAQAVGAAQSAGEEYARWAGLSLSRYWQKVGDTQDALADFLSTTPEPWTRGRAATATTRLPRPSKATTTGTLRTAVSASVPASRALFRLRRTTTS